MKSKVASILSLLLFIPNVMEACPSAQYKSTTEEAYLQLTDELHLEIRDENSLVFSGNVREFSMESEYEIFEVVPDTKEYGNRARIHLGGTCEYIKIYWWEGEPGNSGINRYFMKKIPNKNPKFTPPQAVPRDALSTRPLAWR